MAKQNPGKLFESDFVKSAPENLDVTRLIDAGGWKRNTSQCPFCRAFFAPDGATRFTPSNICDFIIYSELTRRQYKLELKSVDGVSLPFGNINIKKLEKLAEMESDLKWNGLVINFRKCNTTVFVLASTAVDFINLSTRASIPVDWALDVGKPISQELIRVRWRYDLSWM